MKDQHLKFLLKFHKPTSRHLYTLRYGRVVSFAELTIIPLWLRN